MKKKIFIHTNNKQMLGAKISKFSIERYLPSGSDITVDFINVDNLDIFKKFAGKRYLYSKDATRIYDPNDLQSFTLSRFMPPELMNYDGLAVVIDPDIFAIKDMSPLFKISLEEKRLAACRKDIGHDSSVMLMNTNKLKHWKMENFLDGLVNREIDYVSLSRIMFEPDESILDLPRIWNNLDRLTPDTHLVHMSKRLTQPWKTGLKIDFSENPMSKILGIIPREPIYKLLGKIPNKYQPHPDKNIELLFFRLVAEALNSGFISKADIQQEIDRGDVRPDLLEKISKVKST
jgi:hypothetical protein